MFAPGFLGGGELLISPPILKPTLKSFDGNQCIDLSIESCSTVGLPAWIQGFRVLLGPLSFQALNAMSVTLGDI